MISAMLHAALLGLQTASAANTVQRRVFVVDKVSQVGTAQAYGNTAKAQEGEHHSAPVVMSELSKKCPIVLFTTNRESAEFILDAQQGASSLVNQKGDVLYISPANTMRNMAKDVCRYISAH